MFTTKDGAKLITPGRQESMHFETALTFSKKSIRLHRQTGQTQTGMDNPTTGLPRWRIEVTSAPSKDEEVTGLTCPLISAVGFPSATHQSADNLERAPLSRSRDLENIVLTHRSTVIEATKQLKLTATVSNGETTTLLPRSQALANLNGGKWEEFKIWNNQIPTELINACHTHKKDTHRRAIVIFCDEQFSENQTFNYHIQKHHGINLQALPQATPRLPAQPPQACHSDHAAEVMKKLDIVINIARRRSNLPAECPSPQEWNTGKRYIQQFFKNTPDFLQFLDKQLENKGVTNDTIWLPTAWEEFTIT